MRQGTTVTCPNCQADVNLGVTFKNVRFSNNVVNLGTTCGECGTFFDAAPSDGVYTSVAGRLRWLGPFVTEMLTRDRDTLEGLRDELRLARAANDQLRAANALRSADVAEPSGGWDIAKLSLVIAVLGVVLTLIAMARPVELSPGSMNMLVTRIVKQVDNAPPTSPPGAVTPAEPTRKQIQQWIDEALATASPAAPGQVVGSAPARNRPCTCGSGRKYKKCCGAKPQFSSGGQR